MRKILLFVWLINVIPNIPISVTPTVSISITVSQTAKAQFGGQRFFDKSSTIVPAPIDTGWILVVLGYDQSNGVGRLAHNATYAVTVPAGVYEFNCTADTLQQLTEPTGQDLSQATGESLLSSFGKQMKDTLGRKMIVVKRGLGNTGIQDWLSPGYIDSYTKPALDSVNAYIARHGIVIKYRVFLGYQGENNVLDYDTDQFIASLYNITNYIYTIFPYDVFVNTRIGYDTSFTRNDSTPTRNIMKAQSILGCLSVIPKYVTGTNQVGTYTAVAGQKGTGSNEVHLTTLGLNGVGYALASAATQWLRYGTRISLPAEPEPTLALDCAADTITRYTNLLLGPWDWEWLFHSNVWETQNDVSTRYYNFNGSVGNPTFTSSKLVLDTNGYCLIGRQFVSDSALTLQWSGALSGSSGIDYLTTLTQGQPTLQGGTNDRVQFEWKTGAGNYCYVEFHSTSTAQLWLVAGLNPTSDHTYKIVRDKTGNTLDLYVDGVQQSTVAALAGTFNCQIIGGGAVTKDYNYRGTLYNFKIKNSL